MEIKELETILVKYYKKHQSEYVQKTAMRYIDRQIDPKHYSMMFQAILKSHPFNYGFPDVAAVEQAHERHYDKEGKSLRKEKPKKTWHTDVEDLSEEDKAKAEVNRDKWKDLVKSAEKGNRIKLDDICKKCSHRPEYQENIYCRGCIDHNKYDELKK